MKISNSSDRLKELMRTYDLKQSDIVEKTGFPKSAVSMYISGKREPRQDKLTTLANAFNINETWLMGYDVPMDRNINIQDDFDSTPYNKALQKLQNNEKITNEEVSMIIESISNTLDNMKDRFLAYANELDNIYINELLSYYNTLNSNGKKEAIKSVKLLTYAPEFQKQDDHLILNAAHAIEGATEEEIKHDDDIMDDKNF